jgi:rhodanese-related sulfurtransferase
MPRGRGDLENKIKPTSNMKKLLTIATTLLIAAAVYAGEYPDISITELRTAIEGKKVTLLDANGTESWQKNRVPGAIDFAANQEKLAKVLPADKKALVVAYCANPKCTAYQAAAKAVEKLGYTNVKHMSVGIQGWVEAGQKVEKGSAKTDKKS